VVCRITISNQPRLARRDSRFTDVVRPQRFYFDVLRIACTPKRLKINFTPLVTQTAWEDQHRAGPPGRAATRLYAEENLEVLPKVPGRNTESVNIWPCSRRLSRCCEHRQGRVGEVGAARANYALLCLSALNSRAARSSGAPRSEVLCLPGRKQWLCRNCSKNTVRFLRRSSSSVRTKRDPSHPPSRHPFQPNLVRGRAIKIERADVMRKCERCLELSKRVGETPAYPTVWGPTLHRSPRRNRRATGLQA